jgi:hypothetical protein
MNLCKFVLILALFYEGFPNSEAQDPSSKAPSNSSKAPSNSSKAPSNSSKAPSDSSIYRLLRAQDPSSKAPSNSSKAPSNSSKAPSDSPSTAPTSCSDDEDGEFLLKVKKGRPKTQSCDWLNDKNKKTRMKICKNKLKMTKTISCAQYVCPVSCDSCSACYENKKSKFAVILKKKKTKLKSCKWLGEKDPAEITKICTDNTESKFLYGPPAEVCPETCSRPGC